MEIILLIGMPGSGKTHYGKALSEETGYVFLDDLKDILVLKDNLINRKSCIIADPWLCLESILDSAVTMIKAHGITPQCIFWKNDYEQCVKNVKMRNDGRKVDLILQNLKTKYNPPQDAREVWKGNS